MDCSRRRESAATVEGGVQTRFAGRATESWSVFQLWNCSARDKCRVSQRPENRGWKPSPHGHQSKFEINTYLQSPSVKSLGGRPPAPLMAHYTAKPSLSFCATVFWVLPSQGDGWLMVECFCRPAGLVWPLVSHFPCWVAEKLPPRRRRKAINSEARRYPSP